MIQRHNEIRDALGDLASLVYKDVIREPIVQEANDACGIPSLVADLIVLGGYGSLRRLRCLIYVSLTLTLRRICTGMLPLSYRPLKKKRRENIMMQQKHGMLSIDGVLGQEAECFIQLLADKIAQKWKKPMLKLQDGYEPGCPLPF